MAKTDVLRGLALGPAVSSLLVSPRDLIDRTCHRFERATGRPLVFVPCRGDEVAVLEARLRDERAGRWTSPVPPGADACGVLYVDPVEDRTPGDFETPGVSSAPGLLEITDLAELVTGLVGNLASASSELESRSRDVSMLTEIGRTLPHTDDASVAVRRLLAAAIDLTRFRAAAFLLLDPVEQSLKVRAIERTDPLDMPSPRTLDERPPDLVALVNGEVTVTRDSPHGRWLPESIAFGTCLAVPTSDGPIGTLWLYDRRHGKPTSRELDVLRSIAAQLGGVLERAVLQEESADQHRMRRELASVSDASRFEVAPDLPANAHYEVAAACTSRYEVGGDLCEVIPLDEHRAIVVVGDACGDGVPAALVVAAIRGTLHGLLDEARAADGSGDHLCPPHVVARLNRVLCRVTAPHQFASLFYGLVDTQRMTFTYSNAGHPCPLHVRRDRVDALHSHGLLLGVLPESTYKHETIRLRPGDLVVGFSDGLTEVVGRGRGMFRSTGIAGAIRPRRELPVDEIVAGVWAETEEFAEGTIEDDRTLLVVRVRTTD